MPASGSRIETWSSRTNHVRVLCETDCFSHAVGFVSFETLVSEGLWVSKACGALSGAGLLHQGIPDAASVVVFDADL